MGYQEVEKIYTTSHVNGEELTLEMQESCREVATELRFIGDTLQTNYQFQNSGTSRGTRIVIGATLLGVATNVVLRYFASFFARNT